MDKPSVAKSNRTRIVAAHDDKHLCGKRETRPWYGASQNQNFCQDNGSVIHEEAKKDNYSLNRRLGNNIHLFSIAKELS